MTHSVKFFPSGKSPRRLLAGAMAATLANPEMIKAYMAGAPGNGKPFPDGSKMAKIHWNPKKLATFPAATDDYAVNASVRQTPYARPLTRTYSFSKVDKSR
jgi:hypothetical protein